MEKARVGIMNVKIVKVIYTFVGAKLTLKGNGTIIFKQPQKESGAKKKAGVILNILSM